MRNNFYQIKQIGGFFMIMLLWLSSLSLFAQERVITGTVIEAESGETLSGVTVLEKGTLNGTVSDVNGLYKISVNEGATLVFAFVGYVSLEVTVDNRSVMDVKLPVDVKALQEVVVIGYGEQSTKEITTAVTKVDAKQIESLPVYRPEQALQGTAPGIIIIQESGSPGSPLTVRIRGIASAQESAPLYLVDGIQVPNLDFLNSSDIDNVSVLKDGASAAIYGARGGNGVVLVTTKSGKRNLSNPKVSISGYYGIQNLANKPELMDRDQFIEFYNNSVDWYGAFTDGSTIPDLNGDGIRNDKFSSADAAQLPNTDWYDVVFDQASMSNLHASVQDGGEDYSYALSAGLFNQDGMVGGDLDKSNFERKTVKLNFEKDVLKGLNIQVDGLYGRTDRNSLTENGAGTGFAIMNYINNIPAIYPAYAENGEIFNPGRQNPPPVFNGVNLPIVGAVTNPLLALELNNTNTIQNYYSLSGGASYEVSNFRFSTKYAHYGGDQETRNFIPVFSYPEQGFARTSAQLNVTNGKFTRSQWENTINYAIPASGGSKVDLLVGSSVIEDRFTISSMSGNGFFTNSLETANFSLMQVPSDVTVSPETIIENGWLSFFGRANYAYKEKYLLSVTLRADASSKFGKDNRTGYFPSVSAGWNLSEEAFLSGSDVFDLLKLRASWGVNGNDQIGNSYAYLSQLTTNAAYILGGAQTTGIAPSALGNPDVKWEEVTQTNIGLDANMIRNQLGISVDYFIKKTTDMLAPVGTPILVGQASPFKNVADVENKGLEVLLTYKKVFTNKLSLDAGFNIATIDNKVTALGEGQPFNSANIQPSWPEPIARTDVGHPIASFYGYEVSGLNEQGDLVFKDNDGVDGITPDDKTFIGNPYPDFTYGFTLNLKYQGFDLNAFLFGSQGNDIYKAYLRPDAVNVNKPASDLNAWTATNSASNTARSNLFGLNGNLGQISDYYIEDGSFARLKTLTLGYTLPAAVAGKLKASKIRFYITASNLFTITDYSGVDPEIGQSSSQAFLDVGIDRGFYPQPRTFLGGFQINLF
ncbi:TonB-dependent receptor [Fulvivirgaceae bacterium BMA12]|uniref:TonB-dependent receptor n=1 Tax=Agaribacillus aureus TaxID=3051825 RepID=A0ABT8LIU6_9BACT|nr:TonB-dependent receptor [Fulvivirgaceae bacterium BMA12]